VLEVEALSLEIEHRLKRDRFTHLRSWLSERSDKYVVEMEADGFVATVAVWKNGCCDFDFLDLQSKTALAWHYEFCCAEDAIRCITHDIDYLPSSARQAQGPVRR